MEILACLVGALFVVAVVVARLMKMRRPSVRPLSPAEQVRALVEARKRRLARRPEPEDPPSPDLHGGFY